MHKDDITKILKTWNLWDHEIDYGIMRNLYVNRITSLINESTINIIIETGIRRSGKSFIAKQVAKKLVEAKVPRKISS